MGRGRRLTLVLFGFGSLLRLEFILGLCWLGLCWRLILRLRLGLILGLSLRWIGSLRLRRILILTLALSLALALILVLSRTLRGAWSRSLVLRNTGTHSQPRKSRNQK